LTVNKSKDYLLTYLLTYQRLWSYDPRRYTNSYIIIIIIITYLLVHRVQLLEDRRVRTFIIGKMTPALFFLYSD